ncbi:hypothetical protein G647_09153 [Cladophialophora carrionii CBS 160.54]|uniref:Uncharacterized protein n=1 Tax=Cladophialophora carrionii CBS 160.54 TaxID=1279043 RepID=V9CY77_9EURO|nr:uncharacterized protein G647_09153 [Cladophialophora carrionii CBS 160.54]ETI19321.1 hypothetical protein G647_09153 [Cladophialophora carrionii CBS 160.54]
MCEKQIMTPCNSILYCSEACRRKDAAKPLSASTLSLDSTSPSAALDSSPRPTLLHHSSARPEDQAAPSSSSSRIPVDIHDHKSDLDPTEWKPKLPHRGASTSSEAFRYLSRFHQAQAGNIDHLDHGKRDRAPATLRHKSTLSMSTLTPGTTTPSLANTPTTTASSVDSMYEFNLRPLAPRTNPLYSTSAGHSRGIDLVTPHIPPPAVPVDVVMVAGSAGTQAGNDLWDKKVVVPGATPKGEGLGVLFGRDG